MQRAFLIFKLCLLADIDRRDILTHLCIISLKIKTKYHYNPTKKILTVDRKKNNYNNFLTRTEP